MTIETSPTDCHSVRDASAERSPSPPVCAVVVAFHPQASLNDLVAGLLGTVRSVVVVDNSGNGAAAKRLSALGSAADLTLVENPENLGIARALNTGLDIATALDCEWGLLLDQDSVPAPALLEDLLTCVGRHHQTPVGVVGTNYVEPHTGKARYRSDNGGPDRVSTVITSGSLISLDAYRRVGRFRDDFFIDSVDHEYCLRLRRHGFAVVRSRVPHMTHPRGDITSHRVLGLRVDTSNHPAVRRYYMTRNQIVMCRENALAFPGHCVRALARVVADVLKICLLESQRIEKLRLILTGLRDGVLCRMGPLQDTSDSAQARDAPAR